VRKKYKFGGEQMTNKNTPKNFEEYRQQFSDEVQEYLQNIRHCIISAVPEAKEKIAYAMPAYTYEGKPLLYFAAFKSHIGVYATPVIHEYFAEELAEYKQGKGSVQFPFHKPMPYDLISRMTMYKKHVILDSLNKDRQ